MSGKQITRMTWSGGDPAEAIADALKTSKEI